ncbi:NHL repeat containing protein [Calothrix sp. PCC 7507]|uniref:NHL repeat containing protein n=1 Tax=Calothrix sp. PCC 7507 TaxID=99598 RepID=UPI00029EFE5B|nr:NHL repeat containing protein [Calothrix sp. PCC 7507]AFY30651.1 NHL repeat containing protein [Calothrix sp. PCC 7507]
MILNNKQHLFSLQGAEVILGDILEPGQLAIPIAPSAKTMFGPRAACLISETGPLWVSDTGHHRLLGWRKLPTQDSQNADWVIGQPDFYHEGQNAKSTPGKATFSVPTGICACGGGLVVADAWNHRILIWKNLPEDHNVPADLVLGQANFKDNEPNRGSQLAAPNTLNWPYGVFYHQGKLFVADTGNRRVLIWHQLPTEIGQPADLVLGQPDMISRNENGGNSPTAASMRWCHDITFWGDNLVVTDAGNHRVMIWQGMPTENNAPCSVVLGQKNFDLVEMNQGFYLPSASSLSMPYGVDVFGDWLLVADTANSRLLGWRKLESILSLQGAVADIVAGQVDFKSKGENHNFGLPTRDSLNWCYGVKVCGNTAVVADSGNNRILLWRLK